MHTDQPNVRVVGLGAPVSVLIRFAPCETPFLRSQLLKRPPEPDEHPEVLRQMLASLDEDGAIEIAVLWPTAYAAPVLRAALGQVSTIVRIPQL